MTSSEKQEAGKIPKRKYSPSELPGRPAIGVPIQGKLNLKKLSPPHLRSRRVFIVGFPPTRPSPLNTLWSCEKGRTKLATHIMQDSTLCPRQYIHAPLLCRGALCRVSHRPGKHPPYTQVLGCDIEGGRATRMAPDATTEKIRDKKQK